MGFLFAPAKKNKIPEVTGLQIQTAVNSLPIPIVFGSPRVPMNIIYANGFRSVKQRAGGKGLFGGGKGNVTGYKYYATFIGALGEGEWATIYAMFENQNVYTPTTLPHGKTIIFFSGSDIQTPWSYITTHWPADAFGYKDTVYLGFQDYEIDQSGTIPQLNFIGPGLLAGTCPLNAYTPPDNSGPFLLDADPAQCVYAFLTNSRYGVEFPVSYIDTTTVFSSPDAYDPAIGDAALQTYCQALGFGWSVALNNGEPASSILDRWFKNLVVAAVWTGEKLRFIPYSDLPYSVNPGYDADLAQTDLAYFSPENTPLFELTVDDFLRGEEEDDPVTITRVDPFDMKNTVLVNFRDRYNYFNDNLAEAKDELEAELYGPRVDKIGTADEFSLMAYASLSAQLQLQRNIAVRWTAEFRLPPQWCILEPMDILALTLDSLRWNQQTVRVREIEEQEDGSLKFIVEEYRRGSMGTVQYARQTSTSGNSFQTNIPAPSVNVPAIFEPTADYIAAQGKVDPTVVIGVSGGPGGVFDPNWGGAQVWLSNDNITYSQYGSIVGPAKTGELTADLPAYVGGSPDTVNTLSIDISESDGELVSVTDFQAIAGLSLCVIIEPGGVYEFVGYVTATLTGTNTYDLTRLYRGMFGTVACAHPSGSKFVRFDSSCFELTLPPVFIGTLVYVKLPSFNIFGLGLQDISDATAYAYTPQGWGSGVIGNPLAQALQSGVTPIDLDTFAPTTTLDLGSIVVGDCAPVGDFNVDLENY